MPDIKVNQLTKKELKAIFEKEHRWELKQGLEICFGMEVGSFDWSAPKNSNTDPVRVFNWCCRYLNGGEPKKPKAPKMIRVNSTASEEIHVLRDDLIAFGYAEWPNFFEQAHAAWREYRTERDGCKISDLEQRAMAGQKYAAILEYRKYKDSYDSKGKKWPTKGFFAKSAAKNLGTNLNTTRRAASKHGIDLSLEWAQEHEASLEYQNTSWENLK